MGKTLGGLFAATLMAGGLTAFTAGGAEADPYPGTVNTVCRADNLNNPRVGNPARVEFRVGTNGNGAAKGNVTFEYERRSSEFVVKQFTRRYDGPGREKYAFDGIPRGKYVVRVFFNSKPASSVYQNCRTSFRQTVRARG